MDEVSKASLHEDPLATALVSTHAADFSSLFEYLNMLNVSLPFVPFGKRFESLDRAEKPTSRSKTSIEEPPVLELK